MKRLAARGPRILFLALWAGLISCDVERKRPAPTERAQLGGEVAARVDAEVIPVALVRAVAAAKHLPARESLTQLIDDAVAASAGRTVGRERDTRTRWLLTAARARMTADLLLAKSREAGPPNEAEIAELTVQHWRQVDRPSTVRTVHAVAQRPTRPDPAAENKARAVAEKILATVASARSGDEFESLANSVLHPGVDVVVQALPPFTPDGRVSEGEGSMDAAFAAAAHASARVGPATNLVETPFGWHVIYLVEVLPEQRMALDARRIAFTDEVYVKRARALTQTLLNALKLSASVDISPSAERLMRPLSTATSGASP